MDELLDLVNENDEVVGEVWRSEATGNKDKIIREVAVLIFDNSHRILLQQRSLKKRGYPGYWVISVSGHVDKGEAPEHAANKEVIEELGIDVRLKLVDKKLMRYPTDSSIAYRYVGEYNDNDFVIQKEEVEDARFFTKDEFEVLCKKEKVEPTSAKWCREFWKGN